MANATQSDVLGKFVWYEASEDLIAAVVRRMLARHTATAEISRAEQTLAQFAFLSAIEGLNRELKFPFHFSFGAAPESGNLGAGYAITIPVAIGEAQGIIRLFVPESLLAALPENAGSRTRLEQISWPIPISSRAGWTPTSSRAC